MQGRWHFQWWEAGRMLDRVLFTYTLQLEWSPVREFSPRQDPKIKYGTVSIRGTPHASNLITNADLSMRSRVCRSYTGLNMFSLTSNHYA